MSSTGYSYMFKWKIENYLFCFKKTGELIESPIFAPDCLGGSQWQIQLFPKGKSEEFKNFISLQLLRCNDQTTEERICLDEKWELICPDGNILKTKEDVNLGYTKGNSLIYNKFFDIEILDKEIKKSNEDVLIIQCYLRKSKLQIHNATTQIIADRCSFQWDITYLNSSDWLESKKIYVLELDTFLVDITAPNEDISIKISKSETACSLSLSMSCKVFLVDIKGNKVKSVTATHLFDVSSENNSFQFPSFIKKSDLESEKKNILKNGSFTLEWELSCSKGDVSYEKNYMISTITKDFKKMYDNQKYCDVQLRCNDVMLPAHKFILASRSIVFDTMFNQNMTENNKGIIEIVDIEPDTLKLFLEYLYDESLNLKSTETAIKLLLLAEQYQVLTLKEQCCSYLIPNVTVKNVCEVLVVADMIGHKGLKSSAMDCMKSNAKIVLSSSKGLEWIQNNPKLAYEIILSFV